MLNCLLSKDEFFYSGELANYPPAYKVHRPLTIIIIRVIRFSYLLPLHRYLLVGSFLVSLPHQGCLERP